MLLEHDAVRECAVTGVPDPVRGKAVKATIVLADGYAPSDALTTELQRWVKRAYRAVQVPAHRCLCRRASQDGQWQIRRAAIRDNDENENKDGLV